MPTNVSDPRHYHKVVDCQWACPAHTNVPEYLRLIANGKYAESYLLNRESNVFPGILGRTCDRPCEPACRRGRIDGKPVAICRLKRVAADLKGDVSEFLPKPPSIENGKKIALIGCGPSSLTVANDLRPLGYSVTILEKRDQSGGLMRWNIPAFRLPPQVLDEEINAVLDTGVELKYNSPVTSMKALLAEGYDAVFVGSGAPKGKELDVPGRHEGNSKDVIHIGIEWLGGVHFGHIEKIEQKVLIIGVGNTAMDCCRTAKRLGATDVKVMARRNRKFFKASPWELEDAEEELVEIVENHAPKRFVYTNGKLTGMEFEVLQWSEDKASGKATSVVTETKIIPCDSVILAIGQDNAFEWVERDIGIEFDKKMGHADCRQGHAPEHDQECLLRRRRRVGPGQHHLGRGAWASGGHLHSSVLREAARHRSPRVRHEPRERQGRHARVGLQQRLQRFTAPEDDSRGAGGALQECAHRSRTRLHP